MSGGLDTLGGPDVPGGARLPVANTHVHLPPNFSAFYTAEDAVEAAVREGVRVMGTANFHDLRVNARFAAAAEQAGIVPLFGLEAISLDDELQQDGIRVNDPVNPGRMYLCGKGLSGYREPSEAALHIMAVMRAGNEGRMQRMTSRLGACFAEAGFDAQSTDESIAADVADRADVPRDWVVLQERHLAMAFQQALFERLPAEGRADVLTRVYGRAPVADRDDAVATQGEIRSRLMKAGGAAFEPETPVPFEDVYRLVLELDGIPCYPTLADGVSPACEWEDPPAALAERLVARGIHTAELIPVRNQPAVVDAYVAAFRAAGILVLAGTEHNTQDRIPLEPRCVDGAPLSATARQAFWEATCVVAAHQHLRSSGRAGYVDREGHLHPGFPDGETRIRWFRDLGASLIAGPVGAVSR